MNNIKYIIEFLKLPVRIIVALCIASIIILFIPDKLAENIYMINFREKYGFIIGITFVITLSITACYVLFYAFPLIWEKLTHKKNMEKLKKGQQKFLDSLNDNEIEIIREILRQPDNTLELPMNRGIIRKLEYHLVISKAGTNFAVDPTYPIIPYFLQPWVFDFFDEKGNLIKQKENN